MKVIDNTELTEEEIREVIEAMENMYPPTEEYYDPDFKPTRKHYEEYVIIKGEDE